MKIHPSFILLYALLAQHLEVECSKVFALGVPLRKFIGRKNNFVELNFDLKYVSFHRCSVSLFKSYFCSYKL